MPSEGCHNFRLCDATADGFRFPSQQSDPSSFDDIRLDLRCRKFKVLGRCEAKRGKDSSTRRAGARQFSLDLLQIIETRGAVADVGESVLVLKFFLGQSESH